MLIYSKKLVEEAWLDVETLTLSQALTQHIEALEMWIPLTYIYIRKVQYLR